MLDDFADPADREPPMSPEKSRLSITLSTLAGIYLMIAGAFQFLQGLVALFRGSFYNSNSQNLFAFNATSWGAIHLLLGLIVLIAGSALLVGRLWGRVVGIIFSGVSAVANFLFIPEYPVWSVLIVVLNLATIWALVVYVHAEDR